MTALVDGDAGPTHFFPLHVLTFIIQLWTLFIGSVRCASAVVKVGRGRDGGQRFSGGLLLFAASKRVFFPSPFADTYTVTLDAQGGTGSPATITVTFAATYPAISPSPTKTGYTFAGWFDAATGGSSVTTSTSVTTAGDHTIYARWTASIFFLCLFMFICFFSASLFFRPVKGKRQKKIPPPNVLKKLKSTF